MEPALLARVGSALASYEALVELHPHASLYAALCLAVLLAALAASICLYAEQVVYSDGRRRYRLGCCCWLQPVQIGTPRSAPTSPTSATASSEALPAALQPNSLLADQRYVRPRNSVYGSAVAWWYGDKATQNML